MENILHDEELKEDFIELQINQHLEIKFESKTLAEFWYTALDMFLRFGGKAFKVLVPFATYLCEFEFSSLLSIKTTSRLSPESQAGLASRSQQKGYIFFKKS